YSPPLALLAVGLTLGAACVSGGLAFGELHHERARLALRGQEDGLVLQIIQGIAKLRVGASEARLVAGWGGVFARQKRHFAAAQRYASASTNFTDAYTILATLALFYVATQLLQPEDEGVAVLGLGAFLAVNAAFGQLLAASTTMARALASALEIVPLVERTRPTLPGTPHAH